MDAIALTQYVRLRNVRAFLWMLRYGEGTQGDDGYRTLFGGTLLKGPDGVYGTADDFTDHPRKIVTMKLRKGGTLSSSAAGAYQFLMKTWDGLVRQYGFANFEPTTQDLAAIALIAGRGALQLVIDGKLEEAVVKCNREWASLPGSPYGQPVVSMEDCIREYIEAGGVFGREQDTAYPLPADDPMAHLPAPKVPTLPPNHPINQVTDVQVKSAQPVKESAMPIPVSLIAAILPSLINLVPQLGKMFGSGSESQVRNVEAATAVLEVAKTAIGARNEQEMLEEIQSNPEAAETVREAIQKEWFRIEELGGGIEAAREAAAKTAVVTVTTTPDGGSIRTEPVALSKQPAFIVTCALVFLVFVVVAVVLVPWEIWSDSGQQIYSDELRLVVVTAIIGALGTITAFWLGSSFGSQKKDEQASTRMRATDLIVK